MSPTQPQRGSKGAGPHGAASYAREPFLSSRGVRLLWATLLAFFVLVCFRYGPAPDLPTLARPWAVGTDGARGAGTAQDSYLIGVGRADITGPVVEINMMGYADPNQIGTGLRQRLFSRAFIVGSPGNPQHRFVYLVLDTQSGDTAVRYGILSGLKDMGPAYEAYGHHNLAVTGTHSHSGPGAWLNYLLPQITSKGFDQQSYRAIVDGALLSIKRAHESLQPGYLAVGSTKVFGASINCSLFAYFANPLEERARYNVSAEDDGSVERDLTMLKFQRASDGKNVGVLTWFATHGTSMLGNNTLISGDNKGVAAWLFEKSTRETDPSAAEGFVAGFSQSNMGDVSPNVLGAWCEDGSGEQCSFENSTCPSNGKSQFCHARGPFFQKQDNGAASCFEIGRRQFEGARRLYDRMNTEAVPVAGRLVRAVHSFHNMSNFSFLLPNGTEVRTCPAALGYSFAAGTSDGPGVFDFTQHDSNESNTSPVWRAVSGMVKRPTERQVACHAPKPILLDVGEMRKPYMWTPNVVDIQVFRVGQLMIIVSPGEATTMAGRRWKDAVGSSAASLFAEEYGRNSGDGKPLVVIGGPANSYTHYITTEEEYGIQRYEGASTLYGPHTLAAYINRTLSLLPYLGASSETIHPPQDGPLPPDNSNVSMSFIPGVIRDGSPLFKHFGDVLTDTESEYHRGQSARATFVAANPRNNLRLEDTYCAVERRTDGASWGAVREDDDWSLLFEWRRTNEVLGTSEAIVTWEIEDWAEPGVYRLRYSGDAKSLSGKITAFDGWSSEFHVH